jgi:hypothetical protein
VTITITITTFASIIITIAIIITIIVAILHQMRPAKFSRTVPQSNDGIDPAIMMTFNLQHVRILNSNCMNELRNDLMLKGCMTE